MTKIVINNHFGGFSISRECAELMASWGCRSAKHWLVEEADRWYGYLYGDEEAGIPEMRRDDHYLVQAVEDLGDKAAGDLAGLKIVDIPDGVEWQIEEYDGREWIAERHRTWG